MKTSLAPGSKVVTDYLDRAGLTAVSRETEVSHCRIRLHDLHWKFRAFAGRDFEGRSTRKNLVVASVLSGNRNFEGRINPEVRANYLMSPPLVVAFALAGRIDVDLAQRSRCATISRASLCIWPISGLRDGSG